MFWTVELKDEKRTPNGYREFWDGKMENTYLDGDVYENPIWDDSGIGSITGKKIPRKFKKRLVVKLNESKREGKTVRRKTIFRFTLRYWRIVEWVFEVPNSDWYLSSLEYHLGNTLKSLKSTIETIESLINKLEEKLAPFIEVFKDDYEQEFEYTWLAENIAVYEKGWEEELKKQEAKQKESRDYQEKSWKAGREWDRENYSSSYSSAAPVSQGRYETEIIKAGFKALSKKYHPDAGGKTEDFQELENAKSKMMGK